MNISHSPWLVILAAALAATGFGTGSQAARGITQVTDNQSDDVTPKVSRERVRQAATRTLSSLLGIAYRPGSHADRQGPLAAGQMTAQ
jgi:hypothetical protein